jgi:Flp pilus assembly protein TadG
LADGALRRGLRERAAGQAIVEFAVILPVMLLLVLAVGDFGRLYTSAVAIEAGARQAADYGAFSASSWSAAAQAATVAEMERRACAAASMLPDYVEPAGTLNHATCTNPTFSYVLERQPVSGDCSDPALEPPSILDVTLAFAFHPVLAFPPIPATVTLTRDSRYALSDLASP